MVTLPSGETVAADAGVVAGRVTSDAGLPVTDASVRLTSTSFRHTTDDDGAFRFVNVTAGAYTLRVEANGFHVHEAEIEAPAADILTVNVTLLPKAAPGYRAHTHNLWRGLDEVTIFQGPVGPEHAENGPVLGSILQPNIRFSGDYRVPLPGDADPPALVYPGAGEVHVTFDWDDTPPMPPKYGLKFASASTGEETLEGHGPGEPWIIEVTPEMADNGHQSFSLWSFAIATANDALNAPDYRPAYASEDIEVTITVIKGSEPPMDPAHPTFWEGGDELVLRDHDDGAWVSQLNHVPTAAQPRFLLEDSIVPPGTGKLLVEVHWEYTEADGSPIDQDYELYWNTARQHYDERPRSEWSTGATVLQEDEPKVWEIELEDGDADAFYQQKSAWAFALAQEGSDPGSYPVPDHVRNREFTIKVTALRDTSASVQ